MEKLLKNVYDNKTTMKKQRFDKYILFMRDFKLVSGNVNIKTNLKIFSVFFMY